MSNTLVTPAQLVGFDGAPFDDWIVDGAVAEVRRQLGWVIAPSTTETLTVDAHGGMYLFLRSLHVTAVSEVRDISETTPEVIDSADYRLIRRSILLRRQGWWYCGDQRYEVDVTHGHDACPADLLKPIAEICQRFTTDGTVESYQIDDFREAYRDVAASPVAAAALSAYRVPRVTA